MPSDIPLRKLKAKLAHLKCHAEQRKKATHWKVTRNLDGVQHTSGFVTRKGARHVSIHYVSQLKDQLRISDEEWENA